MSKKKNNNNANGSGFEKFASKMTRITGSNYAFFFAVGSIVVWLVTGPIFNYSDTWQLVINTGTTIITFLMVFLIQKTQNKDSVAIQVKLSELVAASEKASNRVVSAEDMTEEELLVLSKYYTKLALMSKKEENLQTSHSIEEAKSDHEEKYGKKKKK